MQKFKKIGMCPVPSDSFESHIDAGHGIIAVSRIDETLPPLFFFKDSAGALVEAFAKEKDGKLYFEPAIRWFNDEWRTRTEDDTTELYIIGDEVLEEAFPVTGKRKVIKIGVK